MAHLVKKSIVVIENNPANMKLFMDILNRQGYEVHTAHDGQEGLRAIQNHRPDLVIMDRDLPKLPSQQLAQFLNNNVSFSNIPTLCIVPQGTTFGGDEAQFTGVLQKPFTVNKLVRFVNELMEKHPLPDFTQNNASQKRKKIIH